MARAIRNFEGLSRLVEQAKSDPQFFHDLVWNTEKAIGSADYLSRNERAAILAIEPEDLVVGLATGGIRFTGEELSCGGTCGASCGASCGATCGGSCTATCAASCPLTGALEQPGGEVINPAVMAATDQLSDQIYRQLGQQSFSRFRR